MPVKPIPYNIYIFSILAILGIIINSIFTFVGKNMATSTVWTYGFSILALCGLIISSFALTSKMPHPSGFSFFKAVINNALPAILIMLILSFVLYQNISFFGQINDGKVPDEYYTYSGIVSFLILVQIIIVIKYLIDELKGSKNTANKGLMNILAGELYNVNLIFTITNIGFIAIIQVILKLFSTGG
jgi:hypothetical protein